MQLGNLDRRIRIDTPTASADAYGQKVDSWATLATVWAYILYTGGGENYEADQKVATNIVKFIVRYRSDLTERMRVVYESGFYDILHIEEVGRHKFLVLKCEKKDSGS